MVAAGLCQMRAQLHRSQGARAGQGHAGGVCKTATLTDPTRMFQNGLFCAPHLTNAERRRGTPNGGYSRELCLPMITRRSGRPELRVVARSEEAAVLAPLAVSVQRDLSARILSVRGAGANTSRHPWCSWRRRWTRRCRTCMLQATASDR